MLYNIDNFSYVLKLPYQQDFDQWMSKLNTSDYDKIVMELNSRVDGNDVNTSSWIPGSNWNGTVYQPIFTACNNDQSQAAKFFGLILFKVMMDRPEVWSFGRYKKDNVPIKGLTYFLIENPPKY